MLDYRKLILFFDEYISHYRELLKFENQKLHMIVGDNIEELNNSLSKEQAFIMKTNVLESKRLEILTEENKNKTFKEIIEQAPKEYKLKLEASFNEISRLVFQIKRINQNAQEIVSKRLQIFKDIENNKSNETYTKNGVKSYRQEESVHVALNKDI